MAEVIRKATNRFNKGLIMDFSPENTKNDTLTHALNATLLTFNGNELSLQNDMGNARVETAFLPEGYMPVGTCEYGGIIYVVSYNPIEDKSQIGCFPSPERTVSNDELGEFNVSISKDDFQDNDGKLKNTTQCVLLKKDNLNPGDKFIVTASDSIYEEALQDMFQQDDSGKHPVEHPRLALNVVSIEDSGRIVYLNSDIRDYTKSDYTYHILGSSGEGDEFITNGQLDLEDYRSKVSSGYSVFKSKTSGKLAILAELVMIDSYSVTHSIVKKDDSQTDDSQIKDSAAFDVVIHTEVEPAINANNYAVAPKLKNYYLKKSQGYLQRFDDSGKEYKAKLFTDSDKEKITNLTLGDIYETTTGEDLGLSDITLKEEYFEFPKEDTYYTKGTEFIPNENNEYEYPDVKLATFKVPSIIINKSLPDLPFKYDYTIVPCMDYGKLDHLAVSNTVDFSKLHDFEKSNFTTWKYHIDGDQLRLTFGADIYDTFETDKVNGLFLEFYDLWGFAGSLEITNKKSYSGVYTKIISLNTLNALSKKKIIGKDTITENYKHNINIIFKDGEDGEDGKYYYNNTEVTYNEENGWSGEIDNDCGTLYSNILYGVKAYLRIAKSDGTESYKHKRDLFLFTLPIYNDFFYTISDFSTIENPQLDMVLTYRLEDLSNLESYDNESLISGYTSKDYETVKEYESGNYSESQFEVTKYHAYKGTSKLFLEVGLKKEYNDLYLFHDASLNSYFKGTIKLIGDESDEEYFNVKSKGVLSTVDILNYPESIIRLEDNFLRFSDSNKTEINIDGIDLKKNIDIDYKFIIGYKALVENIKKTPIPTNTFCALYHKDDSGKYNPEDFGIYVQTDEDDLGNLSDRYYSNALFYNSGTDKTSIFGIGKQVGMKSSDPLEDQIQVIDYVETETEPITTLGRFNAGEPLQQLVGHIGKLTFCQPHVHGLGNAYGTNIGMVNNKAFIRDGIYYKDKYAEDFKKKALYNLSLNTKGVIDYNTEFISSIAHSITSVILDGQDSEVRKYTGITADQLEHFNSCLLETMSSVYAYNPDYNTSKFNVGEVSVLDNGVQFTSNLLSVDSKFVFPEGKTLNNYIYLGGSVLFSEYINQLTKHSDIVTDVKQLKLVPNYTYCGTSTSPYLLSSLTYNTPVPDVIKQELEFQQDNLVTIRHKEGDTTLLKCVPDKRTLYGFQNGVLVQLDVANYHIEENGKLIPLMNDKIPINSTPMVAFPYGKLREEVPDVIQDGSKDYIFSFDMGECTLTNPYAHNVTGFIECSVTIRAVGIWITGDSIIVAGPQPCVSATLEFTDDNESVHSFESVINAKVNSKVLSNEFGYSETLDEKLNLDHTYYLEAQEVGTLKQLVVNSAGVSVKNKDKNIVTDFSTAFWDKGSTISVLDTGNYESAFTQGVYVGYAPGSIILSEIKIKDLIGDFMYESAYDSSKFPLFECEKTPNREYITRGDDGLEYKIDDSYVKQDQNIALVGTSITLNDLIYEPSISGHRLYVRKSKSWLQCFNTPGDVYYRRSDQPDSHSGTENLNKLSFYTGPSFI